jgi:hypothetical protein
MKKTVIRVSVAALTASSLIGNAWAGCVSAADMAALKTAAMQQELMVAAFSCHAIGLYNHFVRSHQPELIRSDAQLKAYFVQRDSAKRGEAGYHTYKTELANAASLRSLHDDAFCDRANADFDLADSNAELSAAVDEHRWPIEATYHACRVGDAPTIVTASGQAPPARTRPAEPDYTPADRMFNPATRGGREASTGDEGKASNLKMPTPHRHLEGDAL